MGSGLFFLGVLVFGSSRVGAADEASVTEPEGVLFPPGLTSERRLHEAPLWDGAPVAASLSEAPAPRSVRLVWSDPASVADVFAAAAREETARIFSAAGIAVSWVPGDDVLDPDEIRVILLDRPGPSGKGCAVLGSTPTRFERAPYVWVHLPSVVAVLGLAGRARSSFEPADWRGLALALGRVIAHEVVHALAPGVPHDRGLMAAKVRARDLVSPELAMPTAAVAALQTALGGGTPRPAVAGVRVRPAQPRS